jgi:uncharacterized protein
LSDADTGLLYLLRCCAVIHHIEVVMRLLYMLMFIGVLSLVLGGAHYYVYHRLVHFWQMSAAQRRLMVMFALLMLISTVLSVPLSRLVPREFASVWAWIGFSWLGVILFAVLSCLVVDVGMLVHYFVTRDVPVDEQRRRFLQRAAGVTIVGAVGMLSGISARNALRPVAVKPLQVNLPRLSPSLDGLRLAQLTDIHIGPTLDGVWLRDVVARTNALHADIIVITGDLVDGSVDELREHIAPLKELSAPHGVYFITGNHEYYSGVEEWVAHIAGMGIRVLRNDGVRLYPRGEDAAPLYLAGVDDYHSDRFAGHRQDIPKALAGWEAEQEAVILLAHQPVAIHEAAAHKVDLQLSGHTHGGQIYPFNYAVRLQQPYVRGLHTYPDSHTQIYVSCGTGFWGPPMRLGTAAEITHITLRVGQPV